MSDYLPALIFPTDPDDHSPSLSEIAYTVQKYIGKNEADMIMAEVATAASHNGAIANALGRQLVTDAFEKRQQEEVRIAWKLTEQQFRFLATQLPTRQLKRAINPRRHSHPVAAVLRDQTREEVLARIRPDAVIVDIGGKPSKYATAARQDNISCLNRYDNALDLRRVVNEINTADRIHRPAPRNLSTTQGVACDTLLALDSVYDTPIPEFLSFMSSCGARTAFVSYGITGDHVYNGSHRDDELDLTVSRGERARMVGGSVAPSDIIMYSYGDQTYTHSFATVNAWFHHEQSYHCVHQNMPVTFSMEVIDTIGINTVVQITRQVGHVNSHGNRLISLKKRVLISYPVAITPSRTETRTITMPQELFEAALTYCFTKALGPQDEYSLMAYLNRYVSTRNSRLCIDQKNFSVADSNLFVSTAVVAIIAVYLPMHKARMRDMRTARNAGMEDYKLSQAGLFSAMLTSLKERAKTTSVAKWYNRQRDKIVNRLREDGPVAKVYEHIIVLGKSYSKSQVNALAAQMEICNNRTYVVARHTPCHEDRCEDKPSPELPPHDNDDTQSVSAASFVSALDRHPDAHKHAEPNLMATHAAPVHIGTIDDCMTHFIKDSPDWYTVAQVQARKFRTSNSKQVTAMAEAGDAYLQHALPHCARVFADSSTYHDMVMVCLPLTTNYDATTKDYYLSIVSATSTVYLRFQATAAAFRQWWVDIHCRTNRTVGDVQLVPVREGKLLATKERYTYVFYVDRFYAVAADNTVIGLPDAANKVAVSEVLEYFHPLEQLRYFAHPGVINLRTLNGLISDGPPGCGKTHTLAASCESDGLIVTGTVAARDSANEELLKQHKRPVARTIWSALGADLPQTDELLVDEVYMHHAGVLILLAYKIGAKRVIGCGDAQQIGFVSFLGDYVTPYATLPTSFEHHHKTVSMRVTPAVARATAGLYDENFKSCNDSDAKLEVFVGQDYASVIARSMHVDPNAQCVTITQSAKDICRKINPRTATAHEWQGTTASSMVMVRVVASKSVIYEGVPDRCGNKQLSAHYLVGLTRSTGYTAYVTPTPDFGSATLEQRSTLPLAQYKATKQQFYQEGKDFLNMLSRFRMNSLAQQRYLVLTTSRARINRFSDLIDREHNTFALGPNATVYSIGESTAMFQPDTNGDIPFFSSLAPNTTVLLDEVVMTSRFVNSDRTPYLSTVDRLLDATSSIRIRPLDIVDNWGDQFTYFSPRYDGGDLLCAIGAVGNAILDFTDRDVQLPAPYPGESVIIYAHRLADHYNFTNVLDSKVMLSTILERVQPVRHILSQVNKPTDNCIVYTRAPIGETSHWSVICGGKHRCPPEVEHDQEYFVITDSVNREGNGRELEQLMMLARDRGLTVREIVDRERQRILYRISQADQVLVYLSIHAAKYEARTKMTRYIQTGDMAGFEIVDSIQHIRYVPAGSAPISAILNEFLAFHEEKLPVTTFVDSMVAESETRYHCTVNCQLGDTVYCSNSLGRNKIAAEREAKTDLLKQVAPHLLEYVDNNPVIGLPAVPTNSATGPLPSTIPCFDRYGNVRDATSMLHELAAVRGVVIVVDRSVKVAEQVYRHCLVTTVGECTMTFQATSTGKKHARRRACMLFFKIYHPNYPQFTLTEPDQILDGNIDERPGYGSDRTTRRGKRKNRSEQQPKTINTEQKPVTDTSIAATVSRRAAQLDKDEKAVSKYTSAELKQMIINYLDTRTVSRKTGNPLTDAMIPPFVTKNGEPLVVYAQHRCPEFDEGVKYDRARQVVPGSGIPVIDPRHFINMDNLSHRERRLFNLKCELPDDFWSRGEDYWDTVICERPGNGVKCSTQQRAKKTKHVAIQQITNTCPTGPQRSYASVVAPITPLPSMAGRTDVDADEQAQLAIAIEESRRSYEQERASRVCSSERVDDTIVQPQISFSAQRQRQPSQTVVDTTTATSPTTETLTAVCDDQPAINTSISQSDDQSCTVETQTDVEYVDPVVVHGSGYTSGYNHCKLVYEDRMAKEGTYADGLRDGRAANEREHLQHLEERLSDAYERGRHDGRQDEIYRAQYYYQEKLDSELQRADSNGYARRVAEEREERFNELLHSPCTPDDDCEDEPTDHCVDEISYSELEQRLNNLRPPSEPPVTSPEPTVILEYTRPVIGYPTVRFSVGSESNGSVRSSSDSDADVIPDTVTPPKPPRTTDNIVYPLLCYVRPVDGCPIFRSTSRAIDTVHDSTYDQRSLPPSSFEVQPPVPKPPRPPAPKPTLHVTPPTLMHLDQLSELLSKKTRPPRPPPPSSLRTTVPPIHTVDELTTYLDACRTVDSVVGNDHNSSVAPESISLSSCRRAIQHTKTKVMAACQTSPMLARSCSYVRDHVVRTQDAASDPVAYADTCDDSLKVFIENAEVRHGYSAVDQTVRTIDAITHTVIDDLPTTCCPRIALFHSGSFDARSTERQVFRSAADRTDHIHMSTPINRAASKLFEMDHHLHYSLRDSLSKDYWMLDLGTAPGGAALSMLEHNLDTRVVCMVYTIDPRAVRLDPRLAAHTRAVVVDDHYDVLDFHDNESKIMGDGLRQYGLLYSDIHTEWTVSDTHHEIQHSKKVYGAMLNIRLLEPRSELYRGGCCVIKMMGSLCDVTKDLVDIFSMYFVDVRCMKPSSSRITSSEWYLVGLGYRPSSIADELLDRALQYFRRDIYTQRLLHPSTDTNTAYIDMIEHVDRRRANFLLNKTEPYIPEIFIRGPTGAIPSSANWPVRTDRQVGSPCVNRCLRTIEQIYSTKFSQHPRHTDDLRHYLARTLVDHPHHVFEFNRSGIRPADTVAIYQRKPDGSEGHWSVLHKITMDSYLHSDFGIITAVTARSTMATTNVNYVVSMYDFQVTHRVIPSTLATNIEHIRTMVSDVARVLSIPPTLLLSRVLVDMHVCSYDLFTTDITHRNNTLVASVRNNVQIITGQRVDIDPYNNFKVGVVRTIERKPVYCLSGKDMVFQHGYCSETQRHRVFNFYHAVAGVKYAASRVLLPATTVPLEPKMKRLFFSAFVPTNICHQVHGDFPPVVIPNTPDLDPDFVGEFPRCVVATDNNPFNTTGPGKIFSSPCTYRRCTGRFFGSWITRAVSLAKARRGVNVSALKNGRLRMTDRVSYMPRMNAKTNDTHDTVQYDQVQNFEQVLTPRATRVLDKLESCGYITSGAEFTKRYVLNPCTLPELESHDEPSDPGDEYITEAMRSLGGDACLEDTTVLSEIATTAAINVSNYNLSLTLDKLGHDIILQWPKYHPVYPTYEHPRRANIMAMTIPALVKRNFESTDSSMPCLIYAQAMNVIAKFLRMIGLSGRIRLSEYRSNPISMSREMMAEWLSRADNARLSKLEMEVPCLNELQLDKYEISIKPSSKVTVSKSSHRALAPPQVLAALGTPAAALAGNLFSTVLNRVQQTVPESCLIMSGYSLTEINRHANRHVLGRSSSVRMVAEGDFSNFDKTQGAFAHVLKMVMLDLFGVESWFIRWWSACHTVTQNNAPYAGIAFTVGYQHKSGDASTTEGNTVLTLLAVVDVLGDCGILASYMLGDDNLVFLRSREIPPNATELFAERFNIECKLVVAKTPYMCGLMLINTPSGLRFLPDPVKRLNRLGSVTIRNREHLEANFPSFCDLARHYSSASDNERLAACVAERYDITTNISPAIDLLYHIAQSFERYCNLWQYIES